MKVLDQTSLCIINLYKHRIECYNYIKRRVGKKEIVDNIFRYINMQPTYQFDIKEDNSIVIELISYISRTTNFDHIIYKKRPYYERRNSLNEHKKILSRPKYDKDIECSIHMGYLKECEALPSIIPKNPNNVKYVIEYEPCNDNEEEIFEMYEENPEFINMVDTSIKNLHNIQLIGYKNIHIHNNNGINNDHRGSNHCKIALQYYDDYIISTPLTAHKLALAYYRIKSHKFDDWYELYCNCNCMAENDTLNVYLNFDHGS
jgi:hypothetical protein